MKLNFLESGIDSLRKGFDCLIKYEEIQYYNINNSRDQLRFFHLKDSILFIQHGVEILFKQLLQKHSEYLLFSQIDENVKKAFRDKNQKRLNSVFESDFKHKIHTVTFTESIERLKIIPNIYIKDELEKKLRQLEVYRNIIMHAEPHINEVEINNTFDGLSDELDNFFNETLGGSYKTISGYGELTEKFETFKTIIKQKTSELKLKSTSVLIEALKYSQISIGSNEIKRVTNINKCFKFLEKLLIPDLRFGTDLFNGYCSGSITKIKRCGPKTFMLYASDIDCYYEFDLKSIVISVPSLDDNSSPIIFIESDEVEISSNDKYICDNNYTGIKSSDYYQNKNDLSLIYEREKLPTYVDNFEDENIDWKSFNTITKFFSKGLFCFINVQGLTYNYGFKGFIYKNKYMDAKQLEVILRKVLYKELSE